jgi:hypothetical protein
LPSVSRSGCSLAVRAAASEHLGEPVEKPVDVAAVVVRRQAHAHARIDRQRERPERLVRVEAAGGREDAAVGEQPRDLGRVPIGEREEQRRRAFSGPRVQRDARAEAREAAFDVPPQGELVLVDQAVRRDEPVTPAMIS